MGRQNRLRLPNFFKRAGFAAAATLFLNMWGGHMIRAQGSNGNGEAYVASDRFGNRYTASDMATYGLPKSNTCQAGMFTLYFDDVINSLGCGFDEDAIQPPGSMPAGSLSLGELRQQVVCRVFEDLSVLINEALPGTTNVNIRIVDSGVCNPDPSIVPELGPGTLAAAGQYYRIPLEITDGFVHGEVWKAVNGATDHPGDFHGIMRFSFDQAGNQLFYLDPETAASGAGLEDLYSVTLHEALHVLGFASLIDLDGVSKLEIQGYYPDIYSTYDSYLESSSGTPFINLSGAYGTVFNPALGGTPPLLALTSGCGSPAVFDGVFNPGQAVHTPSSWSGGSSISHFNCIVPPGCMTGPPPGGNSYVMNFCIDANAQQRHPIQAEVNTLCDLGYSLSGVYGNVPASHPFIYQSYTACGAGCVAAGGDDIYTMDPAIGSITVNDVFGNDFSTSGNLWMNNLEIVTQSNGGPAGTLSGVDPATGTFTFTPAPGFYGQVILRYTPDCGGSQGNMTFITINIPLICDENTVMANPCELICYGDFEIISDQFVAPLNAVDFGSGFSNSPDLVPGDSWGGFGDDMVGFGWVWMCDTTINHVLPNPSSFTTPNTQYVAISAYDSVEEDLVFELKDFLVPGETYLFGFDLYAGCSIDIELLFSEVPPCPFERCNSQVGNSTSCSLGVPPYTYMPVFEQTLNLSPTPSISGGYEWQRQTFSITIPATVTQNIKYLSINGLSAVGGFGFGFYDNFSLRAGCCPDPDILAGCRSNLGTVHVNAPYTAASGTWNGTANPFGANPVVVDGDIIIPNGVSLEVYNTTFEFTDRGRVIVQRGGVLTTKGCTYTSHCPDVMWQGIQVIGPGDGNPHITSPPGTNYGLLSMGACTVENAIIGVASMAVDPMNYANIASTLTPLGNFEPFTGIASLLFPHIFSLNSQQTGGGLLYIDGTTFDACFHGINTSWYYNPNNTMESNIINHDTFVGSDDLPYPLPCIGSEAGISALSQWLISGTAGANQGVSFCTFDNVKFGVRAHSTTGRQIYFKNLFDGCQIGISARKFAPQPQISTIDQNEFDACWIAVQGDGSFNSLTDNVVNTAQTTPNYPGFFANGQITMGFLMRGSTFNIVGNEVENVDFGTAVIENDANTGLIYSNFYDDYSFHSIGILGNNTNIDIKCNLLGEYQGNAIRLDQWTSPGFLNQQGDCPGPPNDQPQLNAFVPDNGGGFDIELGVNTSPFQYWDWAPTIASLTANDPTILQPCFSSPPTGYCDVFQAQQAGSSLPEGAAMASSAETGENELAQQVTALQLEGEVEAAIALLETSDSWYAQRQLAGYHIAQGNWETAETLLDGLPLETPEDLNFRQLNQILLDVGVSGRPYTDLTDGEVESLTAVAGGETASAYRAQAWLYVARGTEFPLLLPDLGTAAFAGKQAAKGKTDMQGFYPNPANSTALFDYHLPEHAAAQLAIYDLHGRLITREKLKGAGTYEWNTARQPEGVYLYTYTIAGEVVLRSKLMVVH